MDKFIIIKFIPKIGIENSPNSGESFDEKMITTAQKMQQDVSVDKFVGNILCSSKIYTQRGKIQLQETILARENKLKNLKESLTILSIIYFTGVIIGIIVDLIV